MLKIGIKEIKNNIQINILVCIQLVIVFVLAIAASSIVAYHYRFYNNFKYYFESEGYLYNVDYYYLGGNNIIATDTGQLETALSNTTVTGCYTPMVNYYDADGTALEMKSISYDSEIIKRHEPELSEGRWIDSASENDSYIEAVISPNDYGINVGDTIYMNNIFFSYPKNILEIRIVGMLEDNAKIIGYTEDTFVNTGAYSDIYCDYSMDVEEVPVLLINHENMKHCNEKDESLSIEDWVTGWVFVSFSDDITEDEIINNEQFLNRYSVTLVRYDMNEVREKSRESLREKLMVILPIFIGAFVLTIISSLCSISVSVKKQMKNYSIYSICGMPWQRSSRISVIATFILAIASLVISLAATGIIMIFNPETTISLGGLQLLSCLGVILVYCLISTLMPSLIINGTSIKEVLRNNE